MCRIWSRRGGLGALTAISRSKLGPGGAALDRPEIRHVGGADDGDLPARHEAVHQRQQLGHDALLDVADHVRTLRRDGVDLVQEHDGGRLALDPARTPRAGGPPDSPTYFCMISGPFTWMNVAWTSVATARAISVLPVPGGPYSRTPRGGSMRMSRLNRLGYFIGSSISSRTRVSSRSRPPMSS